MSLIISFTQDAFFSLDNTSARERINNSDKKNVLNATAITNNGMSIEMCIEGHEFFLSNISF